MSDDPLLGAIVRRLVHDVANPLSAAQLLAEDGDPLLLHSIHRVADLLALYRAIFGGQPHEAIDVANLWRCLAAAVDPAALTLEVAPDMAASTLKAGAALVLGTAGRGQVRLAIGADAAICLQVEHPRSKLEGPFLSFAERLVGPLERKEGERLELRSGSRGPALSG